MTIKLLRTTTNDGKHRVWWCFDEKHTMKGNVGESKQQLFTRWADTYKESVTSFTRYEGLHRISEAVMTVMDVQNK